MPYTDAHGWRRGADATAAFFLLGVKRAAVEHVNMFARLFFFALLLSVFWSIWSATPLAESAGPPLTAAQIVWYFMINECIVLATGAPSHRLEADIRSGDIASALARPLPHGLAAIAEWGGAALYRFGVLAGVGTVFVFFLTGEVAVPAHAVLPVLVGAVLGCVMLLLFYLQLGYVTAWLGTSTPVYWIWQKCLFVAGGMIIPLTLYPPALKAAAEFTPFGAILFAPSSLIFDASANRMAEVYSLQLFWLAVCLTLTVAVERAVTHRFLTKGV